MPYYLVYDKELKTHEIVESSSKGEARGYALTKAGRFKLFRITILRTFDEVLKWRLIIRQESEPS